MYVVLDIEKDWNSVVEKTTTATNMWYTVGIFLGVKHDVLEQIDVSYHQYQRKMSAMLSSWLKMGSATWSSMVLALSKIGNKALGMKIAAAHGKCHLTIYSVTSPHFTLTIIKCWFVAYICRTYLELSADELVIT